MSGQQPTRRQFIKTGVYVAPVILTLTARLSFVSAGSGGSKSGSGGKKK